MKLREIIEKLDYIEAEIAQGSVTNVSHTFNAIAACQELKAQLETEIQEIKDAAAQG